MQGWLAVDVMSCSLGEQTRLYNDLHCKEIAADSQKFIAWGSPDILLLSVLPGVKEAKEAYNRHTDPCIFDRQVHFGHIIDHTCEDLKAVTNVLPLVGVTFVKIKDYPIRKLRQAQLGFIAYDWLKKRLKQIIPEMQRVFPALPAQNYEYILCAATGWADAIIVSFSNSYAPIQLLASLLRNTNVADILDYYNIARRDHKNMPAHALITTCTIPGTHIGPSVPDSSEEARSIADALCSKLANWDNNLVKPYITAHAKPGHLNETMEIFGGNSESVYPTLGRADFAVGVSTECIASTTAHHRFILEKLVAMAPESFLWTETHYGFIGDVFRVENNKTRENERATNITHGETIYSDKTDPLSGVVPTHTLRAFRQIGRSLQGITQHEATRDYYESLKKCYDIACVNSNITAFYLKQASLPRLSHKLAESLSRVSEGLELCFKDRYRGAFPSGSTSAVPALASQASFHKCLSTVDGLANIVLEVVYNNSHSSRLSKAEEILNKWHPVCCCHLGNAPEPSITIAQYLGVGFMNIPSDLMFSPEGVIYVFHEAGHLYWEQLSEEDKKFRKIISDLKKESQTVYDLVCEILGDIFPLSVVFRGDNKRMYNEFVPLLKSLDENSDITQMELRCTAAGMLFSAISGDKNLTIEEPIEKQLIDSSSQSNKKKYAELLDKSSSRIVVALRQIIQIPKVAASLWSLKCLSSLSTVKGLNRSRRALLKAVQKRYEKEGNIMPQENFTHLLWQLLRRAEAHFPR